MNKYVPTRLAEKFLAIRRHLGLSQSSMAKLIAPDEEPSLYRSRVSLYERGTRIPPIPQLLAYSRAVKVNVEVLLDDKLNLPFEDTASVSQTKQKTGK